MSMHSDNSGAGWLAGAVKNNPEGLLLLAAGCALLMRSAGGSRSRDSRAREYTRNNASQSDAGSRGRTVRESLTETAQSAGEYVADVGGSMAETASNYVSSVSNYAEDAARVPRSRRDVSLNRRKAPCNKRLLGWCRSSP